MSCIIHNNTHIYSAYISSSCWCDLYLATTCTRSFSVTVRTLPISFKLLIDLVCLLLNVFLFFFLFLLPLSLWSVYRYILGCPSEKISWVPWIVNTSKAGDLILFSQLPEYPQMWYYLIITCDLLVPKPVTSSLRNFFYYYNSINDKLCSGEHLPVRDSIYRSVNMA